MAQLKIKRGLSSSLPTVEDGSLLITTDTKKIYLDNGSDRIELTTPPPVQSVNGKTGAVSLTYSDVGAPSINGSGASGTWGISITGNAATSSYALKLQTYKSGSTTETYGTSYPIFAQWENGSVVKFVCTNYTTKTDVADKLATARTISITGSVTGSGTFDGSGNLSIATTTNHTHDYAAASHTHSYLPLSGGTLTGPLYLSNQNLSVYTIDNEPSITASYTYSHHALCLGYSGNDQVNWYEYGGIWNFYQSRQGTLTKLCHIDSSGIHGAVWNDYAEFREAKDNEQIRPGRIVVENGDDTLSLSNERLQPGASIISDTYGFAIGETSRAKTPLAVSGRALAYTFEPRDTFSAGDAVCSGPNGTVSKMTREEIVMYPERIIGTVSAIPDYETWGTGNVPVNGRIWIKVK